MASMEHHERLLAALQSESDEAVVAAAEKLFALGQHGSPAGVYLLQGGKAALRLHRLADAVVFLYHGLRLAEPNTLVWAELLVNRAVACAQHGFYRDAIDAATLFLERAPLLPPAASGWEPYVHHALGLAYDRLKEFEKAVPHHRTAAEAYQNDPAARAIATADLAYSLALSGRPDEAERVLSTVPEGDDQRTHFVLRCTTALVRYCQGQYMEALQAGEQAEGLASGQEEVWAVPLAEVRYWMARAAWARGDTYRAGLLGLRVAVTADQRWHLSLREDASDLLTEIMEKGGLLGA